MLGIAVEHTETQGDKVKSQLHSRNQEGNKRFSLCLDSVAEKFHRKILKINPSLCTLGAKPPGI